MMTLFLTSSFAETKDLLLTVLNKDKIGKDMLFITTAAQVEEYRHFIDQVYKGFEEIGLTVTAADIAEMSEKDAARKIETCSVLAVSGGNTFYLLQELKKKNLLSLICRRLSEGMLYAGESAGAIITAPDISYAGIMDSSDLAPELTDTTALALVDFSILPHFGEEPFVTACQQTIEEYRDKVQLLPINNHQAVLVTEKGYRVLGE
ncbi:Type 1 glutamine amidotransferase-like domain-containing protein [Streptococcus sp. H31]|uniref:Type 1 glutamine amidotransferase-like domain-containing protein n=1 Tax=Streptococcus huangxiaojuni TaxID=3237239 RepID=UPI0034A4022E